MLRARHLFLAWLACGALQLALLGVGSVGGGTARVDDLGTRTQSAWPTLSAAKRLLAPDPTVRRAPPPFAPAAYVRVEVPVSIGFEAPDRYPRTAPSRDAVARPLARAPPALS